MDERIDNHIPGITTLATVIKRNDQGTPDERRRRRFRGADNNEHATDTAEDLRGAADRANEKLAARGSPYRFYIDETDGMVSIRLVIIDGTGSITENLARTVSVEQFSEWIIHLETGEGILLDMTG